jgi:porin
MILRSTILCALLCMATPAAGQSSSEDGPAASATPRPRGLLPIPNYEAETGPYLTHDWGGRRGELAERGVQFKGFWTQTSQGVVSGGKDTGWRYGGIFETRWDLDLDRMGAVPGGLLNITTESRYGRSVNGIAGTLLPVNDGLYFPLTDEVDENIPITITELRYTQFLSKQLGVFAGKFVTLGGDLNEFAGGRGDSQFMSHPFLTASVTAVINPYSTLGFGAFYMPSERTVLTTSLFSSADSSTTTGFDELGDGWVWSTSARTQYRVGELPGGMMITGQYGFDKDFVDFSGQFVHQDGISIPVKGDSWNAFWNAWQYLQVEEGGDGLIDLTNGRADRRGYGLFARAGTADHSTTPLRWVVSGGLAGRGVASRDNDSYGIGYVYNWVEDRPPVVGTLVDDSAQRVEAYYTFAYDRGAELTFDLQYADSVRSGIDPATTLGFRLRLQF